MGQWYHIVVQFDLTNSTANDRVKIYVNNVLQAKTVNNAIGTSVWGWNANNQRHRLGGYAYPSNDTTRGLDGYMAEVNFIDGAVVAPTAFGETKETIWIPKAITGLTYGTNGFRMTFADSSDIGNNANSTDGTNDFTTVTGLTSADVVCDSPENNFSTLNNLHTVPATTFSEGNLRANVTNVHKSVYATQTLKTGTGKKKYYFEAHAISGSANKFTIGLTDERNTQFQQSSSTNHVIAYSGHNSYLYGDAVSLYHDDIRKNGTVTASNVQSPFTGGDIAMIAFDAESGKVWFGRNGTWVNGSGSASTTLDLNNHDTTVATGSDRNYVFGLSAENCNWIANFGQDPTFANTKSSSGNSDGTTGSFFYAPPTDFVALNTENMQDPVIDPNGSSSRKSNRPF